MPSEGYEIKIEEIFEGPMDLLLYLIKKAEVDIYDIPIALITDQYLEYLALMESLNIDYAGDFILMASTLTKIKSRMLIPVNELEEDMEDPRAEITKPLLEYLRMKSAAEQLSERHLLGEHTFVRHLNKKEFISEDDHEIIQVGLFELIDAFQQILKNVAPEHRVDLTTDGISVKDRITQIVDILEKNESVTFLELFAGTRDRREIITTLLAILEMVKLSLIRVVQNVQSGVIRLFYQ
jgi:segregation and condensation protein A